VTIDPDLWSSPFILLNRKTLTLLLKILPFISIVVWSLYLTDVITLGYALLMVAINIVLIGSKHKLLHQKLERTELLGASLKVLTRQLEMIKSSGFKASELLNIKQRLTKQDHNANVEIKKLTQINDWLETHHNHVFAGILNALILWDWIWLFAFEKWQKRNMNHIHSWIDDIANWEVLCSIALFKNANPDYTFPDISDQPFSIKGSEIGHPLIAKKVRVANDFYMSGEGSTALITGSNMAGKSTFLRTLALNTCLAYIGAPVCAKAFEVSYLSVFTAMRSNDSLEDEISSFKAELLRLRLLLDHVQGGQKTFYFLDEILKGTNSEDRIKVRKG
jgi:DNA mismatch repair ATPase MutS